MKQKTAERGQDEAPQFDVLLIGQPCSALARAEKTIQEHEVMNLSTRDSEAFFNALASPAKFNDKLLAALKEHEQRLADK